MTAKLIHISWKISNWIITVERRVRLDSIPIRYISWGKVCFTFGAISWQTRIFRVDYFSYWEYEVELSGEAKIFEEGGRNWKKPKHGKGKVWTRNHQHTKPNTRLLSYPVVIFLFHKRNAYFNFKFFKFSDLYFFLGGEGGRVTPLTPRCLRPWLT